MSSDFVDMSQDEKSKMKNAYQTSGTSPTTPPSDNESATEPSLIPPAQTAINELNETTRVARSTEESEVMVEARWVGAVIAVFEWIDAALGIARREDQLKSQWSEIADKLPLEHHRPVFYFGQRTVQIELVSDDGRGFYLPSLNEFRSDAALVVVVDLSSESWGVPGWIERERFAQEATRIDDGYFIPIEKLDDPKKLLGTGENRGGRKLDISQIPYKDCDQYQLKPGGDYVLGGDRVTAMPAHHDDDMTPMPYSPWFLCGIDKPILHMVRQDGHIYKIPKAGTVPNLSKLKPSSFRISDIVPLDEAKRQCAEEGHHFGPYGCTVCGDTGEAPAAPHTTDFGFGPISDRDLNPIETLPKALGTEPPNLPDFVVVQGGRLDSGNVLIVAMTGTENGSSPSLSSGFQLIFHYENDPSEQDLLQAHLVARPYCGCKAMEILLGVTPPPTAQPCEAQTNAVSSSYRKSKPKRPLKLIFVPKRR